MKKIIISAMFLFAATIFCKNINAQTGNYFAGYNTGGTKAGSYLTGVGYSVMRNLNEGYSNTAFGSYAMEYAYTGGDNTAMGTFAMNKNSTGFNNTCIGAYAMDISVSSSYNTSVGSSTLGNMVSGEKNTAVGAYALLFSNGANSSASFNTALGYQALTNNVTGFSNVSVGLQSLYSNTTGYYNVATGNSALYANTTGYYNVAAGPYALGKNINGTYNIAMGFYAGYALLNGSNNNTFIGTQADATVQLRNSTAIGNGTKVSASNQVRIGNSAVTSIGGQVGWTTISDGRFKKDIKENVPGLSFINKLKPVTYNLDIAAINNVLQSPAIKDENGKILNELTEQDLAAAKEKEKIVFTGFVAQDVEKVAKELNYNFSGVDAPKNGKDYYGLRYAEFVVPLVKAVQELSKQNDKLQEQIDELKKGMAAQQSNSSGQESNAVTTQKIQLADATLLQNTPNPFNHSTTISYSLPQKYSNAKIIVTDNSGRTIKEINVTGKGKGSVNVDASALSSGSYYYSLVIDGKIAGSKQMMLAK